MEAVTLVIFPIWGSEFSQCDKPAKKIKKMAGRLLTQRKIWLLFLAIFLEPLGSQKNEKSGFARPVNNQKSRKFAPPEPVERDSKWGYRQQAVCSCDPSRWPRDWLKAYLERLNCGKKSVLKRAFLLTFKSFS